MGAGGGCGNVDGGGGRQRGTLAAIVSRWSRPINRDVTAAAALHHHHHHVDGVDGHQHDPRLCLPRLTAASASAAGAEERDPVAGTAALMPPSGPSCQYHHPRY